MAIYIKQSWKDGEKGVTYEATGAKFEHMESGIAEASASASIANYGAEPGKSAAATKNAEAFIKAAESFGSAGGSIVVPLGQWWVKTLKFEKFKNIRIVGAGPASVLHNANTGAEDDCLFARECESIVIENLRVQGILGGTRDGVHLEECLNATISKLYCKGTDRFGIYAEHCEGITVYQGIVSVNSPSPYEAATLGLMQGGIVLTWNGTPTQACNGFNIYGGEYCVGQGSSSGYIAPTTKFVTGYGICVIQALGGLIAGPVSQNNAGGFYLQKCVGVETKGTFTDFNPGDIVEETGTVKTEAKKVTVKGSGTQKWNEGAGGGEVNRGARGKYLVAPSNGGAIVYARIEKPVSNTELTLEAKNELLGENFPLTEAAASYAICSFDIFLDNCADCTIGSGYFGGVIALRQAERCGFLGPTCKGMLLDLQSIFNNGWVTVLHGGGAFTGGGYQDLSGAGYGNNLIRAVKERAPGEAAELADVIQDIPLPRYTKALLPTPARAMIAYVSDEAEASRFQAYDPLLKAWKVL